MIPVSANENRLLMRYMRLLLLNSEEQSNILRPLSTEGRASDIPTPRQAVPGRVVEEPFTCTDHKENTDD